MSSPTRAAYRDPDLSNRAVRLVAILGGRKTSPDGHRYARRDSLANNGGWSERTVSRAAAELEAAGYLCRRPPRREQKRDGTWRCIGVNGYRLRHPDDRRAKTGPTAPRPRKRVRSVPVLPDREPGAPSALGEALAGVLPGQTGMTDLAPGPSFFGTMRGRPGRPRGQSAEERSKQPPNDPPAPDWRTPFDPDQHGEPLTRGAAACRDALRNRRRPPATPEPTP